MKKTQPSEPTEQSGQTGDGTMDCSQIDNLTETLATWRDAVGELLGDATSDAPGSDKHQLGVGDNGLVFNNANLGNAYVSKSATGLWTEKWFIEDKDALLNPALGSSASLRVTYKGTDNDHTKYVVTSKTFQADMSFVYAQLPSQTTIKKLPKQTPKTSTLLDFIVQGKAQASSSLALTGALMREIDNSGSQPKVTDHWVLAGNYEAPSTTYAQMRVERVDKYDDLRGFLTAMLNARDFDTATGDKWLYAQITYTVESVPVP